MSTKEAETAAQLQELQEQLRQHKNEEQRRAELLAKYTGDPLLHLAKLDAELEQERQRSAAEKRADQLKNIYAKYGSDPEEALLALHQELRDAEQRTEKVLTALHESRQAEAAFAKAYAKAEFRAALLDTVSDLQRDIFAASCARRNSRFGQYMIE